jgi:hypothetical protein
MVFIFLLIWCIWRVLSRVIFPVLLRGYVNRKIRQQEELFHQVNRKKEGEININYTPKPEKNIGMEEGDYVEYEEIK